MQAAVMSGLALSACRPPAAALPRRGPVPCAASVAVSARVGMSSGGGRGGGRRRPRDRKSKSSSVMSNPAAADDVKPPFEKDPFAKPSGFADPEEALSAEDEQFLFGAPDNEELVGEPAVLLAGFLAEEHVRIRVQIDELGGSDIKVVVCNKDILDVPTQKALAYPEPDWSKPRSSEKGMGAGYASNRIALFSGFYSHEVMQIVYALEARGLPKVLIARLSQDNADLPLGKVLSDAILTDRLFKHEREWVKGKGTSPYVPPSEPAMGGNIHESDDLDDEWEDQADAFWAGEQERRREAAAAAAAGGGDAGSGGEAKEVNAEVDYDEDGYPEDAEVEFEALPPFEAIESMEGLPEDDELMDYENHVIFEESATADERLAYVQALVEGIQEARAAESVEESVEARETREDIASLMQSALEGMAAGEDGEVGPAAPPPPGGGAAHAARAGKLTYEELLARMEDGEATEPVTWAADSEAKAAAWGGEDGEEEDVGVEGKEEEWAAEQKFEGWEVVQEVESKEAITDVPKEVWKADLAKGGAERAANPSGEDEDAPRIIFQESGPLSPRVEADVIIPADDGEEAPRPRMAMGVQGDGNPAAKVMTSAELRRIADARKLDYDELKRQAEERGVTIL